jgi:hypothetical protein
MYANRFYTLGRIGAVLLPRLRSCAQQAVECSKWCGFEQRDEITGDIVVCSP